VKAEEKSIELANKFITKSVFDMTDEELKAQRNQGKAFAIICVDEILNGSRLYYPEDYNYWKEVRQEINSL
jgi:hypothetical protein